MKTIRFDSHRAHNPCVAAKYLSEQKLSQTLIAKKSEKHFMSIKGFPVNHSGRTI
jgi:hypothetical protein